MNKKIYITVIILIITVFSFNSVSFAQRSGNKTPEEMAKKRAENLKTILDLSSEQITKVYEIFLEKFNQIKENRENAALTRKQKKEQVKKIYSNTEQKLKEVMSKTQYEKWKACKKLIKDKHMKKYNNKHKKGKSFDKRK